MGESNSVGAKMKKILFFVGVMLTIILGGIFYYTISERQRHEFKVWFLNAGQGDSALIQFGDGETMLVDCGPDKRVLGELGRVLPFYVRTIDYVIATHSDLDHYGGCVDVLKRYDVKHIVVNDRSKFYDPYWREWDKAMRGEGAEIITMASPTLWTIAGDTLRFLSPDPSFKLDTKADDNNNYSIVFQLTHGAKSFLFTGDMEMPLEEALMWKYCSSAVIPCPALRSAVLKVGHHGSSGASSENFLAAVRPEQAIISVGPNRYGHPSRRALKHLERVGTEILRTDRLGAILMR